MVFYIIVKLRQRVTFYRHEKGAEMTKQSNRAAATLFTLLEEEGMPAEAWQVLIDKPEWRSLIIAHWKVLAQSAVVTEIAPSFSHHAREINVLLNLGYTEDQCAAFGPPPERLPGFLSFFDPGWSLEQLHKHCQQKKWTLYNTRYQRCKGQKFIKKEEEPGYRQIRMEAIPGSRSKSFHTQKMLLLDTEEIPPARQVIMGMVIHYQLADQWLFPSSYVRCLGNDESHIVCVGWFSSRGLNLNGHLDHANRYSDVGIAPAKKFTTQS